MKRKRRGKRNSRGSKKKRRKTKRQKKKKKRKRSRKKRPHSKHYLMTRVKHNSNNLRIKHPLHNSSQINRSNQHCNSSLQTANSLL